MNPGALAEPFCRREMGWSDIFPHTGKLSHLKIECMSSKLVTGFLAGLVVGVLFAPDKGSETRRKVGESGKDLKDKFNDYVDSLSDKFDDLKAEARSMVRKGKQEAEAFGREAENTWTGTT